MVGSPLLIAAKARARLQAAVAASRDSTAPELQGQVNLASLPNPADVVITAAEVNQYHGTGTLLFRMFPDQGSIVSLRSSNFYDGHQEFGAASFCLPMTQASRTQIYAWVRWYLSATSVRRILTIPYLPSDPLVALAVRDQFDAPLCTYIMDDKNVCDDGISDELMEEMLSKSDVRLVISPEMRDAYEEKYRMKFWVVPPLVPEPLVHRTPRPLEPEVDPRRGVLLGNIWGQRWLDMLSATFRGTGWRVDWYCNQKDPLFLEYDRGSLEADGIRLMEPVAEARLPHVLSQYAYAVVPSDTLDGQSPGAVQAIAELSLPSRIPTIVATSHLPILVLGSPRTCAARFVTRFDLGEVVPYQAKAAAAALERLSAAQLDIRRRAAVLSASLSSHRQAEWIWRSLELKAACDMTYENLMPARTLV